MSDAHPEMEARMVDVTRKDVTAREAVATCLVRMSAGTRDLVTTRKLAKGDALEVARVAGIMAAKKTAELVPLCHPIALGAIEVSFEPTASGIAIRSMVRTSDRTGVEMEALTAAAVAALTIYDMVKGVERAVAIDELCLIEKSGGGSGTWHRPSPASSE